MLSDLSMRQHLAVFGGTRGWFYLYLIADVFSRKTTNYFEVNETESGEQVAVLMQTMHVDNGAAMESQILQNLDELDIMSSYSQPCVSYDNEYAESVFRILNMCSSGRHQALKC